MKKKLPPETRHWYYTMIEVATRGVDRKQLVELLLESYTTVDLKFIYENLNDRIRELTKMTSGAR